MFKLGASKLPSLKTLKVYLVDWKWFLKKYFTKKKYIFFFFKFVKYFTKKIILFLIDNLFLVKKKYLKIQKYFFKNYF